MFVCYTVSHDGKLGSRSISICNGCSKVCRLCQCHTQQRLMVRPASDSLLVSYPDGQEINHFLHNSANIVVFTREHLVSTLKMVAAGYSETLSVICQDARCHNDDHNSCFRRHNNERLRFNINVLHFSKIYLRISNFLQKLAAHLKTCGGTPVCCESPVAEYCSKAQYCFSVQKLCFYLLNLFNCSISFLE